MVRVLRVVGRPGSLGCRHGIHWGRGGVARSGRRRPALRLGDARAAVLALYRERPDPRGRGHDSELPEVPGADGPGIAACLQQVSLRIPNGGHPWDS